MGIVHPRTIFGLKVALPILLQYFAKTTLRGASLALLAVTQS